MPKDTTYILDTEESEILDFVESKKGKSVKNFSLLKKNLEKSAREHITRKPVTIRIQTPLLHRIRAEASKKGIPYQTYIQSALFEHMNNQSLHK